MPTVTDNDGNSIIQCSVAGCKAVIVLGPGEEGISEGWSLDSTKGELCPEHREYFPGLEVVKAGRKPGRKPEPPILATVKAVRPSGLRNVVYKPESAADIITVHMLESLDWLQGLIRCNEIPLDQRMAAVQHLIKAGQLVIPKSSAPIVPKGGMSKKENANPTSEVPRSHVEELIKMFSGDDSLPSVPASPQAEEAVPGESDGFEPVEYDGEPDPRPAIANQAPPKGMRRKMTCEEKVLRYLREKGDCQMKKLEGCFLTGVGWSVFPDWKDRIQRMVKQKLIVKWRKGSGFNYGMPREEDNAQSD